jgi:hypothetical protein
MATFLLVLAVLILIVNNLSMIRNTWSAKMKAYRYYRFNKPRFKNMDIQSSKLKLMVNGK